MSGAMKWLLQLFSDLSLERTRKRERERIEKSWAHMKYGVTERKKLMACLTERLMMIAIIIL